MKAILLTVRTAIRHPAMQRWDWTHTNAAIFLVLFSILLPAAEVGDTASDFLSYLPASSRQSLLSGKALSEVGGSLDALSLWKASPFESDLRELAGPMRRTLAADTWTLIKLPRSRVALSPDARALDIFRAFTAFSTMEGLKTKSVLFGGEENFLLASYRVDSLASKRRLPDPDNAMAPESASFILYGKDALVGEVYYELRFESKPHWFRVTLDNLSTMRSLLLKLAGPGELLTAFYIIPAGDDVLLYGLTLAKTPIVPGTAGLERAILANRMVAIGKWFAANLTKGQ